MFALRCRAWTRLRVWLSACACASMLVLPTDAGRVTACPPETPSDGGNAPNQQLMINVVVASVKGHMARDFASHYLKHSEPDPNGAPPHLYVGVLESEADVKAHRAFLQTLRAEGLGKLLFEPNLVTTSGSSARFLNCGDLHCNGKIGVQFTEIGARVHFLPTLLSNGRLRLEVEPEFWTLCPEDGGLVDGQAFLAPSATHVSVVAQMQLGQTLLIGGLPREPSATPRDTSWVSKLPFIGKLFRAEAPAKEDDDTVLLVTVSPLDP